MKLPRKIKKNIKAQLKRKGYTVDKFVAVHKGQSSQSRNFEVKLIKISKKEIEANRCKQYKYAV